MPGPTVRKVRDDVVDRVIEQGGKKPSESEGEVVVETMREGFVVEAREEEHVVEAGTKEVEEEVPSVTLPFPDATAQQEVGGRVC